MEESLQEALSKCEKVEKELANVRQQYQSRQQEVDSVDAQARAEKKVQFLQPQNTITLHIKQFCSYSIAIFSMQALAKEVKTLRTSHLELKQEAKQAMQAKASVEVS